MEIVVEVDAKKAPLQAEEVWERFRRAEKVVVGKGKKVQEYLPDMSVKGALMHDVLGRSGNLRAPTLQVGNSYYVGYNESIYKELKA